MAKTTISWKYDSSAGDGFRIYRSDTPMDPDDLPEPLATVTIDKREYDDETVVQDETYYYRVSSYIGLMESVSAELEHVAEASGDEHWDKVVALLHFDESYADEKGGGWTVTGHPIFTDGVFSQGVETTIAAPVHRIESPNGIHFDVDDFTIELFAKRTDVTKQGTIFDFRDSTSTSNPLPLLDMNGDGSIGLWIRSAYRVRTPQNTLTTSFKHIALTKNNGNFRLFVDGILLGSYFSDEALPISTLKLAYNMRSPGYWAFVGVYDELRITKGVARYTENFIPPTEPFPNFGN